MLKRWWERWPGRLEHEQSALEEAGIRYQLDGPAFEAGKVILHLEVPQDGKVLRLEAHFPDVYPYTRFELIAPDLDLPHHQNPIAKNLCLIGRASGNWSVDDTLAGFIRDRLPDVLKAARSEDSSEAAGLEERQAEPFSDYYPYEPGAILLIDSIWNVSTAIDEGKLAIGIHGPLQPLVRGAVLEVRDMKGNTLAKADEAFRELYVNTIPGIWVRSKTALIGQRAKDIFDAVRNQSSSAKKAAWCPVKEGRIQVIGVLFPEETGWRQVGEGWVFVVHFQGTRRGVGFQDTYYFARAGRAGRSDLAARTPRLKALSNKRVAVVGLGCMGAPSALEFAKAGVGELRLVDHDFVDPGTVSRWPLGLGTAGLPKADALNLFIREHYPYTKVLTWTHMVGSAFNQKESDLTVLNNLLQDIDLIYDATAEEGVQYLLSDLARSSSVPYLSVSTTPGGWGGRVARVLPGPNKRCWMCLQHAERSGAISTPPADPGEPVQPAGCASPTFTGAGFDTMEPVLTAVRLAVATLCSGNAEGYPDFDWDVGVLFLREPTGGVIAPRWETFKVERQPSCEVCKNK